TLDLISTILQIDSVLDSIYALLPRLSEGSIDIAIDPHDVLLDCEDPPQFPLSLAHGMDPDAISLLHALSTVPSKDAISVARKRVVDILNSNPKFTKPSKILGKPTMTQLHTLLAPILADSPTLISSAAILQVIAAIIATSRLASEYWDQLLSTVKLISQSPEDAPAVVADVMMQVPQVVAAALAIASAGLAGNVDARVLDAMYAIEAVEGGNGWARKVEAVMRRVALVQAAAGYRTEVFVPLVASVAADIVDPRDGVMAWSHVSYGGTIADVIKGFGYCYILLNAEKDYFIEVLYKNVFGNNQEAGET
ncbi:hypothetical protein HK096_010643, partial [Nowakowskiella sp. JEL0078]